MAKIKEEMLIVKVSTLIKDGAEGSDVFTAEICDGLEEAISDMVGTGHVVEIIKE
jgi:hypothetical protein